MPPETIVQSRWKTMLLMLVSIGFVAIGLYLLTQPVSQGHLLATWGAIGLFGLGVPISAVSIVRPRTLTLDADDFTMAGGLQRAPMRILWSDIDSFSVYRLPRGGKMIGVRYRAGRGPQGMLARALRAVGPGGALPTGWALSPDAVVERLNAWRVRAA
jgi:hypothetical protein